jgi:hypothetical protein
VATNGADEALQEEGRRIVFRSVTLGILPPGTSASECSTLTLAVARRHAQADRDASESLGMAVAAILAALEEGAAIPNQPRRRRDVARRSAEDLRELRSRKGRMAKIGRGSRLSSTGW